MGKHIKGDQDFILSISYAVLQMYKKISIQQSTEFLRKPKWPDFEAHQAPTEKNQLTDFSYLGNLITAIKG